MARIMIVVWKWTVKTGIQKSRFSEKSPQGEKLIDTEFANFFDQGTEKAETGLKNNFPLINKFAIPVENKNDCIIGFTKVGDRVYELKEIKDECDRFIKTNQVLVLLHTGNPDYFREIPEEIHTDKSNIRICLFGGGKEEIYESLINETGQFRDEAILKNEKGNWLGLGQRTFDKVWDYYWWKDCKKRIYELREDLLINLYPHIFTQDEIKTDIILNVEVEGTRLVERIKNFTQYDSSKNEYTINARFTFDDFWRDFESEDRRVLYQNLKTELRSLIEGINYNKAKIRKIRTKFDQLLESIPTMIY